MAGSPIANVALDNTFDAWRRRTNTISARLNSFTRNDSQLHANNLFANVSFTAANTTINGPRLDVAGNTASFTANVIIAGANATFTGQQSNTNIFTNFFNVSANTKFSAADIQFIGPVTFSNTVSFASANDTFTGANTNIFSGQLNVTANSLFQGSNLTISTSKVVFNGANTNFLGANTNVSGRLRITGTTEIVGLNTTSNSISGAINEVKTTADSSGDDSLAFAIALG